MVTNLLVTTLRAYLDKESTESSAKSKKQKKQYKTKKIYTILSLFAKFEKKQTTPVLCKSEEFKTTNRLYSNRGNLPARRVTTFTTTSKLLLNHPEYGFT